MNIYERIRNIYSYINHAIIISKDENKKYIIIDRFMDLFFVS